MTRQLTLRAISWYQCSVPLPVRRRLSSKGTSERARQDIEAGKPPVRTFLVAALPLRMLARVLLMMPYDKGEW